MNTNAVSPYFRDAFDGYQRRLQQSSAPFYPVIAAILATYCDQLNPQTLLSTIVFKAEEGAFKLSITYAGRSLLVSYDLCLCRLQFWLISPIQSPSVREPVLEWDGYVQLSSEGHFHSERLDTSLPLRFDAVSEKWSIGEQIAELLLGKLLMPMRKDPRFDRG